MDPNNSQTTTQLINQVPTNPVIQTPEKMGGRFGNKNLILILIIIGVVFVGSLIFGLMPFGKIQKSKEITTKPTPTQVVPTVTPLPQTTEQEVQNIDIGDVNTELNNIDQDLQKL